jgi:alkylated DNA repair dioxygenase AlkB
MNDLFANPDGLESISIKDGELYFQNAFPLEHAPNYYLEKFIADVPWRAEKVVVWGKVYIQPRLVAWYGDEGFDYTYSGIHLNPLPWTKILLEIKEKVEAATNTQFNSVLLNYYRDNRDSMGLHSDDERELGEYPTIASLSFGEARTFILKHKNDKTIKPLRLKLQSGSLLVMKGALQKNWKHGIDKEAKECGPRINLTFRRIVV